MRGADISLHNQTSPQQPQLTTQIRMSRLVAWRLLRMLRSSPLTEATRARCPRALTNNPWIEEIQDMRRIVLIVTA